MTRTPLRETVYVTLTDALRQALTGVVVDRNLADPPGSGDDVVYPRLNSIDGRHVTNDTETAGEVLYSFEWIVEGWVSSQYASDRAMMGTALNLLQARVSEAVVRDEPLLVQHQDGVLEIWVDEPDLDIAIQGVLLNSAPTASFMQTYTTQVRWPRGRPFIDLP
jgi:hypothetical protein